MKALLKLIFLLALLTAAAGFVLMTWYPDTDAGMLATDYYGVGKRWVLAQYERYRSHQDESEAEAAESREISAELEQAPEGTETVDTKPVKVEDGWRGVVNENWYSGDKLKARDLKGRTVLVYEWDVNDADSVRMLLRVEQIWQSFKHKRFMVIASHRGGRSDRVKSVPRKKRLTFPCYEGAGSAKEPKNSTYPFFYVVSADGRIVWRGREERSATEAVVNAISEGFAK